MRALIFFFSCFGVLAPARAAYIESGVSASQSPALLFDQTTQANTFTTFSTQLTLGELKLAEHWVFQQQAQLARLDQSQFGLLNKNQKEIYKSKSYSLEATGSSRATYQRGQYSGTLGLTYPLSRNLVSQYGVETTQAFDFYNKSSLLGLGYKYLRESRQQSYFLDFDFRVKERPRSVDAHELSLFYEQILTENFKFRLRPYFINRPTERPDAAGAEVLFGYAPWDDHTFKSKSLWAQETRTQGLKNERGYFKIFSTQLAWEYELNYSSRLSLAYTYQREDEDNPRNLTQRTLGLDTLGAMFEKKISNYTLKMLGDYSRSNLNSNFWSATLSLRREL